MRSSFQQHPRKFDIRGFTPRLGLDMGTESRSPNPVTEPIGPFGPAPP